LEFCNIFNFVYWEILENLELCFNLLRSLMGIFIWGILCTCTLSLNWWKHVFNNNEMEKTKDPHSNYCRIGTMYCTKYRNCTLTWNTLTSMGGGEGGGEFRILKLRQKGTHRVQLKEFPSLAGRVGLVQDKFFSCLGLSSRSVTREYFPYTLKLSPSPIFAEL
jgi:hypothetical protein